MKDSSKIKISVCIPVYNMEKTIGNTINSVLSQDYEDFELIILDNSSTDNTVSEIKKISDPRIRLFINNENIGAYNNHNVALSKCSFEWIKILHGDDILFPNCFSVLIKQIKSLKDPEIKLISSGYINNQEPFSYVKDPTIFNHADFSIQLFEGNFLGTPSMVIIHKSVFESIGYFDPKFEPSSDSEFFLRYRKSFKSLVIPEVLVELGDDPISKRKLEDLKIKFLDSKLLEITIYVDSKNPLYKKILSNELSEYLKVSIRNIFSFRFKLFKKTFKITKKERILLVTFLKMIKKILGIEFR